MTFHPNIDSITDPVVQFASQHTAISAAIVAFVASWVLYGVLGKRALGADDDYWERIRAWVIPVLARLADARGLYVNTKMGRAELAGYVDMTEEQFERKLQDAGFLRQPLASMHRNVRGWKEDGSWSRTHGIMFPVARIVDVVPVAGGPVRRFVTALDTILARRQTHIVYFTQQNGDETRIWVYCHDEPNPINPLTAFQHYTGRGFRAAPQMARQALATVDVTLERAASG